MDSVAIYFNKFLLLMHGWASCSSVCASAERGFSGAQMSTAAVVKF